MTVNNNIKYNQHKYCINNNNKSTMNQIRIILINRASDLKYIVSSGR